jgi:hypothetical protein
MPLHHVFVGVRTPPTPNSSHTGRRATRAAFWLSHITDIRTSTIQRLCGLGQPPKPSPRSSQRHRCRVKTNSGPHPTAATPEQYEAANISCDRVAVTPRPLTTLSRDPAANAPATAATSSPRLGRPYDERWPVSVTFSRQTAERCDQRGESAIAALRIAPRPSAGRGYMVLAAKLSQLRPRPSQLRIPSSSSGTSLATALPPEPAGDAQTVAGNTHSA